MNTLELSAFTFEKLVDGFALPDARIESLKRAIELRANYTALVLIRDAARLSKKEFIFLPAHRFEHLSRGRGWARKGQGDNVEWGERTDGGYRVGPGRWVVGATDGFSRKGSTTWNVQHVVVGSETWTVAS